MSNYWEEQAKLLIEIAREIYAENRIISMPRFQDNIITMSKISDGARVRVIAPHLLNNGQVGEVIHHDDSGGYSLVRFPSATYIMEDKDLELHQMIDPDWLDAMQDLYGAIVDEFRIKGICDCGGEKTGGGHSHWCSTLNK